MTMTLTIILCAILCAVSLLYVLKPMRGQKHFHLIASLCALFSIGLYLALGAPGMPTASKHADSEAKKMIQQEFEFMDTLSKNPDDADTMIRLAALRVAQGRINDETIRLLDRAEIIRPKDPRLSIIRTIIKYPSPAL